MKNDFIVSDKLHPYRIAVSVRNNDNEADYDSIARQIVPQDRKPVHIKQVHSERICSVEEGCSEGDGIYTNNMIYAPYVVTADCFSVFFHTGQAGKFGVIHAGWRSVAGGIIDYLNNLLSGHSSVLIGQGICRSHFTVGRDVMEIFEKKFGSTYIGEADNKYTVDLRGIIESRLKENADIHHLSLCNVCSNEILYSYRKEETTKRNVSLIWSMR
ncbi:MAG: polyphenol oxidase family protein [bacterium]